MVEKKLIKGIKKKDILLYGLSTCVWCGKARNFLDRLGLEYSYVYVDLLEGDETALVKKDVEKWNPNFSFPTIVIDNKECVIGFDEKKLKELLK